MFYKDFVTLSELNDHLARPVSRKLINTWVSEGKVEALSVGSYKHTKERGEKCTEILYSLGKAAEESNKLGASILVVGYTRGDDYNEKERISYLKEHGEKDIEIASDITPDTTAFDFLMKRVKLHQVKTIVVRCVDDIAVHQTIKVNKATFTRHLTQLRVLNPAPRSTPAPRATPRAKASLLDTPMERTPSRRALNPIKIRVANDEYLTTLQLMESMRCVVSEDILQEWNVRCVNGANCKLYHLGDVKEKMRECSGKAVGYARACNA